jgi:hypothetical protein
LTYRRCLPKIRSQGNETCPSKHQKKTNQLAKPQFIKVQFDRVYLESAPKQYDEGSELQIWGERAFTAEEAAVVEAARLAAEENQKKHELAEFERLSKKFKKD